MTELEHYIKSYFDVVSTSDQKTIVSFFEQKKIKRGESILQADRLCKYLGFVQSGLFRMFAYANGKEVTQWISSRGYFVTDLSSFICSAPAKWNIQAITDGELYTISKENYSKLSEVLPKWKDLEKLFLVRCFSAMEERIFTHLSMTTEERYLHFFESNKELFNQVPLQYIASMLGMTPETFSRIRNKLSK